MGETSSCCNPSTYQMEIENIVLPSEALNLEQQTEQTIEEFSEPSQDILATLRRAEQHLSAIKKIELSVDQ